MSVICPVDQKRCRVKYDADGLAFDCRNHRVIGELGTCPENFEQTSADICQTSAGIFDAKVIGEKERV